MNVMKTLIRTVVPVHSIVMVSLVVAALLIGGCNSSSAAHPLPTVHTTATTNPKATFPAFTDWRAGYVGADGHLHAVTLDGKQDLMGPLVGDLFPMSTDFLSAGTSPDGHYFIYPGNTAIDVIDLQAQTAFDHAVTTAPGDGNDQMYWSPDSTRLAYNVPPISDNSLRTLHVSDGSWQLSSPIHVTLTAGPTGVVGWLGAQHLLVQVTSYINNSTEYYSYLYSVDSNSGASRLITALTRPDQGTQFYIPSSDGTSILYYNRPFRDDPFTSALAVIDVATGTIHALPHALHTMIPNPQADAISSVAWNPTHHTIAVSTGSQIDSNLQGWLIDIDHDSASPLPANMYMERWSPDGNTLIGSSMEQTQVGMGPATLSALSFTGAGQYSTVQLTNAEYTFPFVGFIRSA